MRRKRKRRHSSFRDLVERGTVLFLYVMFISAVESTITLMFVEPPQTYSLWRILLIFLPFLLLLIFIVSFVFFVASLILKSR